ncbi:hypothetical protein COLO4_02951 [Corchorus olitorius]|uniref:Uncharacterized protein n=1 Tax=Corchorus olitorius TaxID=93759 RepID=A0A1R3L003_9ROSI|nr:hypothetical protein COLO4_02951 [Corchorus olitorius]
MAKNFVRSSPFQATVSGFHPICCGLGKGFQMRN